MKKFKFIGIILSFLMLSVSTYAVQTKDKATPAKDGICAHAPSYDVCITDVAYELSSLPLVSHDYLRPAGYDFNLYWSYHKSTNASFYKRAGHYRYLDGLYEAIPLKSC